MYGFDENALCEAIWCRDFKGEKYSFAKAVELIKAFHGHLAPGLVIGVKMVSLAMDSIYEKGDDILFDVVCETRSGLPDAVQMLTPCTIGNGWMKIKDIGKYALVMFDKFSGKGVRVHVDSEKLKNWSEFYDWFYKKKPKRDQDFDLLIREINGAGNDVLGAETVEVEEEYLVKNSKGSIATCPLCKEAYPESQGDVCLGCRGHNVCLSDEVDGFNKGLKLDTVSVDEAVGKTLVHDMTRIIPGIEKGAFFKRGQVVKSTDLCQLQRMGKNRVYVENSNTDTKGWIHEDEAALSFAKGMAGEGVEFSYPPREGKISFTAKRDGLLLVDDFNLHRFNMQGVVVCATRHSNRVVKKGESIGATRSIPLYLSEGDYQNAMDTLSEGPVLKVLPIEQKKIGVLVTGTEIFKGLIEDKFVPLIKSKAKDYGCSVTKSIEVPDDRQKISKGIKKLIGSGVELIITTAGLSVDPDDVTRKGIIDAGCEDILYGAPILPGAMTLIARIGEIPLIGVPACGLHHKITSFDLLLPMILAGVDIKRDDLSRMGHGGFCGDCNICLYPNCSFGL